MITYRFQRAVLPSSLFIRFHRHIQRISRFGEPDKHSCFLRSSSFDWCGCQCICLAWTISLYHVYCSANQTLVVTSAEPRVTSEGGFVRQLQICKISVWPSDWPNTKVSLRMGVGIFISAQSWCDHLCWSPYKNVTHQFVLTPTVPILLEWFLRLAVSGRTAAV